MAASWKSGIPVSWLLKRLKRGVEKAQDVENVEVGEDISQWAGADEAGDDVCFNCLSGCPAEGKSET